VIRFGAGTLGVLAFLTSLVQGIFRQGSFESVLWSAWCNLLVFVLVGGIVGWLAAWIMEDVIRIWLAVATNMRRKTTALLLGDRRKIGEGF
jgi:hypothetical protein